LTSIIEITFFFSDAPSCMRGTRVIHVKCNYCWDPSMYFPAVINFTVIV